MTLVVCGCTYVLRQCNLLLEGTILNLYLSNVDMTYKNIISLAVSTRPPDRVLLPPAAPRLVTRAVIRRRFVIVR